MSRKASGFVADGLIRLLQSPWYQQKRTAIEVRVRQKYRAELSDTADYWQQIKVEWRIRREVKRELEGLGSPYCLWISR